MYWLIIYFFNMSTKHMDLFQVYIPSFEFNLVCFKLHSHFPHLRVFLVSLSLPLMII